MREYNRLAAPDWHGYNLPPHALLECIYNSIDALLLVPAEGRCRARECSDERVHESADVAECSSFHS